jgi:hypothetical protein
VDAASGAVRRTRCCVERTVADPEDSSAEAAPPRRPWPGAGRAARGLAPGVGLGHGASARTARRRARRVGARPVGSVSEATCTPGSVPRPPKGYGDGHPSGAAGCPTAHAADPRTPTARRCSGCPERVLLLGLAPGRACLVSPCRRLPAGRLVSVALVLASRRAGVTRYPAPESPDVPHAPGCPVTRDRPIASLTPGSYRADAIGPERGPGSSSSTASAMAAPSTPCAAASRWTPSTGSVVTRAPASRKAAPVCAATSR